MELFYNYLLMIRKNIPLLKKANQQNVKENSYKHISSSGSCA
jgi:hypothetical protein